MRDEDAESSSPASKVFRLLEAMARQGSPMSLQNLAIAMAMPKTSVHRIAMQLEELGYIQREPGTRQMVLAPALVDLCVDVIGAAFRQSERHAVLQELADQIGQSVVIGVRVGNELVYLDDASAQAGAFTFRFRRGLRAPLHCTSQGKIFLSRMPAAEWHRFIASARLERFTDKTITDPETLRASVEDVRRSGFAISMEEFVRGIVGAAVPIHGPKRRIYATLSFAAPSSQMSHDEIVSLRPLLDAAAQKLASTYRGPDVPDDEDDSA